jgi:peroxiredoxin
MSGVELNAMAPDFELRDFNGQLVKLSDFKGKKHLAIALNRGFI